ncbi:MAG: 50S ribosomal protein L23 [Anaerolineales bacterium]|jgi:large subunit ribosomal protein L23|nr:50S ribosomal protein L23 [Anaerolineales bacterium]
MHYRDIIRRPVVTEKSTELADEHFQYVFEVDARANKHQIKEAVELVWPNVDVVKVRVMNMPAKRAKRWRKMITRKKGWKKAIVTLLPGQRLEMFEGV